MRKQESALCWFGICIPENRAWGQSPKGGGLGFTIGHMDAGGGPKGFGTVLDEMLCRRRNDACVLMVCPRRPSELVPQPHVFFRVSVVASPAALPLCKEWEDGALQNGS